MSQFHVTDPQGNLPLQHEFSLSDVPSEMIYKLAVGLEEPDAVASYFGIPEDKWAHMKEWPPLVKAVLAERSKLQDEGVTFKYKMRLLAEDSIEHAYRIAKSSNTPLPQVLEFAKLAAKLADMEPKTDRATTTAAGFVINIHTSTQTVSMTTQPAQTKSVDMIDVDAKEGDE